MYNPLANVPKSYYLPLAGITGLFLAYRFFFAGKNDSTETATPQTLGYDSNLIALGVQTSLERDKLNATTELSKLAMMTELDMTDKNLAYQTAVLGSEERLQSASMGSNERLQSAALSIQSQLANEDRASKERMFAADLTLQNSELGVKQHLGEMELANQTLTINQQANLANYQTMVQHDLGKKGIKAGTQANILSTALSGFTAFFGK